MTATQTTQQHTDPTRPDYWPDGKIPPGYELRPEPTEPVQPGQPDIIRSRAFRLGDLVLSPGGRADRIGIQTATYLETFARPRNNGSAAYLARLISEAIAEPGSLEMFGPLYRLELVERPVGTTGFRPVEWVAVGLYVVPS